ncbi:MAG: hypothetical protein ACXVYI_07105 [Mycobacterium sp.]
MAETPSSRAQRIQATATLNWRLARTGRTLPSQTRYKDKHPRGRAVPVLHRDASGTELLIIRAISRTHGAAQFGVTPHGDVFTTDCDGNSFHSGRREYVTGLSPLLDEAAAIFNEWQRAGAGGRFYERRGQFFDGDSKALFLSVQAL